MNGAVIMEKVLRIAQHRVPVGKAELARSLARSFPLCFAHTLSHSTLNSISGGISVYSTCSLQPLGYVGASVRLCDLIACWVFDALGTGEPRAPKPQRKLVHFALSLIHTQ